MLVGSRVRLRALEREDIPRFVKWMNDPDVRGNLLVYEPISTMAEERWLDALQERSTERIFGIEAKLDDRWVHIGNVGLHGIDLHHRRAEIGIVIGEKDRWGKGYGREAMALMMRFGFHELGLHRIELEVFETNPRAMKTYQALGFVQEGVRRESVFMGGRFLDCVRLGMLRPEFDARFRA